MKIFEQSQLVVNLLCSVHVYDIIYVLDETQVRGQCLKKSKRYYYHRYRRYRPV